MMQPATATGTRPTVGLDREILTLGAVVVLGTIMTVVDLTIVNVAVPTLGSDLQTSISTIQWVVTGYTLAFASVIPLTGWATERFGAKRVWLVFPLLFMLGSVLAGSAWSIGSLILLPLYYQVVRHQSPLQTALLLTPQNIGAAVAMPLAGWLTDRIGARLVVSVGMVVAMLGTLAYTQVGAGTPYLYLAGALLVVGLGIGGALGTALLAIILQRAIAAPALADAFGASFWVAVGLIAAALLPALLLPRPTAPAAAPIGDQRTSGEEDDDHRPQP
jgi:MFS family permease